MKKLIILLLLAMSLTFFASCNNEQNDIIEQPYFRGKVVEKYINSCLIEVVDAGNQTLTIGEKIVVRTAIDDCPQYDVGDYLRIIYSGEMALSYPPQIFDVYDIHKTDEIGNNIINS